MESLALISLVSGILALLCLLILHFVSPEFQPSWRMISEYAMGRHKWLITSFFYFWGASSLVLSLVLWQEVTSGWALFGLVLLMISGIGEIFGGVFDVKHKLHGLAFGLGVPTLPVAALLIGQNLVKSESWNAHSQLILGASHAAWISLVLMALAMIVMMSGFKKAGVPMGPDAPPAEFVPEGVIALAGYANRILAFCYVFWLLVLAYVYITH